MLLRTQRPIRMLLAGNRLCQERMFRHPFYFVLTPVPKLSRSRKIDFDWGWNTNFDQIYDGALD